MHNFFTKETIVDVTNHWGDKTGETKTVTSLRIGRIVACGIVAFILILSLLLSMTTIPTGHTGVITSFGRVEKQTLDEGGPYFKAPYKRVVKMDNRIQKRTLELVCFSADIQETSITYTINYQINKENASEIYRMIGKNYYETIIVPTVTEVVKVVVARYTAENLVGHRDELALAIEKELSARLAKFNIILTSGSIENMDFTDAYTNAVEAKQVAQQNKLKAETEAEQKVIEAKANAEVAREKAQGEADAIKIKADAEAQANQKLAGSITDKVLDYKYYEVWNGELPMVSGDGSAIVIPSDMIPNNE